MIFFVFYKKVVWDVDKSVSQASVAASPTKHPCVTEIFFNDFMLLNVLLSLFYVFKAFCHKTCQIIPYVYTTDCKTGIVNDLP